MLCFRQFQFDVTTSSLYCGSEPVALRPKVAQLLAYFLTHPHQTISRETLLSELWQHGEFREAALTQSITELRQALKDNAQQPTFIKTIPQQGYHWICTVEQSNAATQRRVRLAAWLLAGVLSFISVCLIVSNYLSIDNGVKTQTHAKHALVIQALNNETGVATHGWWGYALEGALRERLQNNYRLVPSAYRVETNLDSPVYTMALSLRPLEQRFILGIRYAQQDYTLVIEQLDSDFGAIAERVIRELKLHSVTQDSNLKHHNEVGLQDYYRGIQALHEQGPKLAKAYFEAALLQLPDHLPTQIELAQLAWQTGDIDAAERWFSVISVEQATDATQVRFYRYYGEFLKAKGQFEAALQKADAALAVAERSQQIESIAMAYQLQSDLFWTLQRWPEYQHAMNAAQALVGSRSFAYSEAQRSFYLANPPAAGPIEKTLLNLQKSHPVVKQAISYYEQTGQTMNLIQALFVYGQNYLLPMADTEQSLIRALNLAKHGGYHYLEQQILVYLGFYYIQLHQGEKALHYLAQSQIDARFIPSTEQQQVLIAMADMDIALQNNDEAALQRALLGYQRLLNNEQLYPVTRANVTLLLAWTWLKAGNIEQALQLSEQALAAYQQLNLGDVEHYARYTLMYIHILSNQPNAALSLLPEQGDSQLALLYGAIAAHQIHADTLQEKFTHQLASLNHSEVLLSQFELLKAKGADKEFITTLIDAPYSVYCQSKWNIN